MSSFVILITVLVGSLIFNGVMFWYLRKLTQRLTFIYQNIGDVSDIVANYRVHLKSVYQMEMFYGDETLQHLLDHTRSISALLEDFEDKEFFVEEFESVEEDAPEEQEEEINAQTQIQQENVFYAGSRRRDS
jgi:spore cortex formation protein SpoVR/YcgB (stage V sporulation)